MKRLWRALIGALWSIPLRFVSIPAIAASMIYAAGGKLTTNDLLTTEVAAAGVAVSVALRFLDNLMIEFAVFPALMRIFSGAKK